MDKLTTAEEVDQNVSSDDGLAMNFRQLAETVPHHIWSARADGISDYYNARFLEFLGKSLGEMQGWTWAEMLHPDDRRRSIDSWTKAFTSGSDYFEEYRIRRASDGRYIWHEGRATPLRDEDGNIIRWFGTCTEVEAHKLVEAKQELLVESISQLLTSQDPQQVIESLCSRVMEFLDCQVFFNFLVDDSHCRLCLNACAGIPKEDEEKIRWLDYGVAVCGCSARDACRIVAEDIQSTPDPRTALIKSYGIRAYACHPMVAKERVLGTLSFGTRTRDRLSEDDLTLMKTVADHVAIALERKRIENLLCDRESRYRELVENANSAIVRWKADGTLTFINEYAQRFFGYASEEVIGQHVSFLLPDKESTGTDFAPLVQDIVSHPERYVSNTNENICRDGRRVWMAWTNKPIFDSDGQVKEIMGVGVDISELKATEEALCESETKYRIVADNTYDWEFWLDPQGRFVYCSPSCERITGHAAKDFLDDPSLRVRLIHPDDRVRFEAHLVDVEQAHTAGEGEWRFIRHDGTVRWVAHVCQPVFDEMGQFIGVRSSNRDITERKADEKVLRENEERLRLALDAAYVVSFEWDIQRNEVRRFVSHEPAFSVTSDEQPGTFEEVVAVVYPDDRELFRANVAAALASENGDYESEHRIVRPDGEVVWLYERGRVKHNEAGQPVYMIGLAQDVSQRKTAEAALRDSEELYRAIGESIDYGVWVCDKLGRNIYASPSFLKLVGLTQEQCSNFGWGNLLHPDDAERTIAAWKECARTGSVWNIEHRFRGVDGQWHPILARGIPVRDDQGNIKFWAGINLDIADLKKIEEDLAVAKLTAEEANRAKSEFLANMSHEIRTPMTVFLGAIEHLLQIDQIPEHRPLLEMSEQSAQRLRLLIDAILDLSRIEARGMEIEEAEFDIRNCLGSAVALFALAAREKNLTLETDVGADVPLRVVGDAVKLGQVLINLIGNALKFTHEGEVRVSVLRRSDTLEFAVADTGIGIPEDKQHLLFQSFSQTDSSFQRRYGGSGLGLAISKGLVQLMGGQINVQSREGSGSVFTFTLPLKFASENQSNASAETPTEEPVRENPFARILLAEDDPSIQKVMLILLDRDGWRTESALTGSEAFEKWQGGDFDLILMDLQMPEMDGIETTRAIRERESKEKKRICIIGLTAHAQQEIKDDCLLAGMDSVLTKPIKAKDLYASIEACLSEKRSPG